MHRSSILQELPNIFTESIIIIIISFVAAAIAGGSGGVGKAMLKMRSKVVDCGPPRLPLLALSEETYKSLESDLRDIGFFEWA